MTGEYPAYRPGGCQTCDYTGFRGRLPVIEVRTAHEGIGPLVVGEK